MITQSIDLLGSIDNDNESVVKTGRKISLLISKFVMNSQNHSLLDELQSVLSEFQDIQYKSEIC